MNRILVIAVLLFIGNARAAGPPERGDSTRLTLWDAWQLAIEHYPSIRQTALIRQTMEYTLDNVSKARLPQLSVAGQATIQSEVTSLPVKLPVAGFTLPEYSKDQYKVYGQIDQLIYDGGAIRNQMEAARVDALISEQALAVELHTVFDRVNQLYFGILLLQEQLKQNDLLRHNIQNGIDRLQAMLDNGLAYKASIDELSAQLLQTGQTRSELRANLLAYTSMLGLLTGLDLNEQTVLEMPAETSLPTAISRPELLWYDYQKRSFDLQDRQANAQLRPRLSLFFQGGYGRPALNMLSNDFASYYIGGIRLNWNFGSFYTVRRQHQLAELGRRSLDARKETFLLNTRMQQRQDLMEVAKFMALAQTDAAIVVLRTAVTNTALTQLDNGVLSAHDYLTQVIAEDQARQNALLHRVQFLQAEYNYATVVGH